MKIQEVYKKFPITPQLSLHMIRAAAVGKYIVEHWNSNEKIDEQAILTMLLLHDTGNIIKFDLDHFPELLGTELPRIAFWKQQQELFMQQYGDDEHEASKKIAREIRISGKAMELLNTMGSRHIQEIAEGNSLEEKICMYSDLRVGPFGVLSVDERFDEIISRYKGRNHELSSLERTEEKRKWCLVIEEQLQQYVSIPLKEITDTTIAPYLPALKECQLQI